MIVDDRSIDVVEALLEPVESLCKAIDMATETPLEAVQTPSDAGRLVIIGTTIAATAVRIST